ncbi:MAG: helix-turn-helix domain-containing protein [Aliarcobacter sp.]|nr:helix-turn-helix domain-containing protein [Aliarcobacter sp.]
MNSVFVNTINNKNISSVLFISTDVECLNKFRTFSSDKYNIVFFDSDRFYLLNSEINSFDLIVFDNSNDLLPKFIEGFKLTRLSSLNVPMILLEDEMSKDLSLYKFSNTYSIFDKNIDENILVNNIELSLNFLSSNKKVQFEKGFYFDINKEILFQDKKIIKLTRIERRLISLLASNVNNLVTYEDISSVVWKGKEFSIYSLRNVVKHIREKTDELFIKNSSNRGYVINTI